VMVEIANGELILCVLSFILVHQFYLSWKLAKLEVLVHVIYKRISSKI
jgi:hypothetical protein